MNSSKKKLDIDTKVSIIIPSYNSQKSILTTLNSIKKQTYNNYECIVVDDHSNDQTISIVENFISADDRFSICLRKSKKKGANACRNQGLSISSGEFIIFLDSDDFLAPHCLSLRLKKMLENPSIDLGVFNTVIVRKRHMLFTRYSLNPLKGFLTGSYPWQTMSPIWKRNALISLQGFDEDFPRLQDVELHARALLSDGFVYKYFPFTKVDSFYVIQENEEKNSEKKKTKQIIGFIKYLEKMLTILKTEREKRFLKKIYYLLIKEASDSNIAIDTQNSIKELGNKLQLSFLERKRIELFIKLNDKKVLKKKYLFEIIFFTISRIKDYLNKVVFSAIHRFI